MTTAAAAAAAATHGMEQVDEESALKMQVNTGKQTRARSVFGMMNRVSARSAAARCYTLRICAFMQALPHSSHVRHSLSVQLCS